MTQLKDWLGPMRRYLIRLSLVAAALIGVGGFGWLSCPDLAHRVRHAVPPPTPSDSDIFTNAQKRFEELRPKHAIDQSNAANYLENTIPRPGFDDGTV